MKVIEQCPVCGKNGITTPLEKCPQCDSDLECFRLLNSLNEPTESSAVKKDEHHEATLDELKRIAQGFSRFQESYEKSKKSSLKRQVTVVLCVVGILFLYHSFYVAKLVHNTGNVADALQIIKLSGKKQEVNQRAIIQNLDSIKIAIVSEGASDLRNSVRFRTYTFKENETIWDVAKQFYGDSVYYPLLLDHNPDLKAYANTPNQPIRILEDVGHVQPIYDRLVVTQKGQKLFKYRCLENDTWEKVSLRFYGHIYGTGLIRKYNLSERNLTPGTEINIPLKD